MIDTLNVFSKYCRFFTTILNAPKLNINIQYYFNKPLNNCIFNKQIMKNGLLTIHIYYNTGQSILSHTVLLANKNKKHIMVY